MIYDQEPEPFEISSALASFDQNSVHNISPIRDMDYFRSEWKHSPVFIPSLRLALSISHQ